MTSIVGADVDGDGVTDVVEVTSVTAVDVDGDGEADILEVTSVAAVDVDGDGVPDAIVMTSATGVDIDGDGVVDVVEVVEAVGVDADGDGVISDDEIEVTGPCSPRTRTPTEVHPPSRGPMMDWPSSPSPSGALVLGGSVAGARLPEIHPASSGPSAPSTASRTGSTGRSGCRCSSATSWSARRSAWPSPPGAATGAMAVARRGRRPSLKLVSRARRPRIGWRTTWPCGSARGRASPARSCGAATCPPSGPSFPSGHVILVAAVACVVARTTSRVTWSGSRHLLIALVMVGAGLRRRAQPARRDRRPRHRAARGQHPRPSAAL